MELDTENTIDLTTDNTSLLYTLYQEILRIVTNETEMPRYPRIIKYANIIAINNEIIANRLLGENLMTEVASLEESIREALNRAVTEFRDTKTTTKDELRTIFANILNRMKQKA